MLCTKLLTENHTAENISHALKSIVDEWQIVEKVVAIVTDNASNMSAAITKLGWTRLGCFAHTLNVIVSNAIKISIEDIQRKCKKLVGHFHKSVNAAEKLKQIQDSMKAPNHKLINDVETRWNSTYYMFERLVEQNDAVTVGSRVQPVVRSSARAIPANRLETYDST